MISGSASDAREAFPHTQWSLVLAAIHKDSPESTAALDALCRGYWYPLYAYVRRCGNSSHDAQDLTQEFFCRLLDKNWLNAADRHKGRLRGFLVTAMSNFMNNQWRQAATQKRGGGRKRVPFDAAVAESRYAADESSGLAAQDIFDRHWALTVLELALTRLRQESMRGAPASFEALKGCLTAPRGSIHYPAIAKTLCLNEGAARVAVHRLRKRFREIYREELMQTLADSSDLDTELSYLAKVLADQS